MSYKIKKNITTINIMTNFSFNLLTDVFVSIKAKKVTKNKEKKLKKYTYTAQR